MEFLAHILAHPALNDRAKVVLLALHQRPTARSEELAQATHHSQRTTQMALRELLQAGLIEAQYHRRQVSYRRSIAAPQYDHPLHAEVGDGLE